MSLRPDTRTPSVSRLGSFLFLFLLVSGAVLRLSFLEIRPLHGDEAVGASLSSDVAKSGSFVYHSSNRHGPFQYFVGGWVMRWQGETSFWIRFPYALAGSLVLLACIPLRRPFGEVGWLLSCSLLTFSPILVYYSRYAVQEIYLVAATALLLSCGLRFAAGGGGASLFGMLAAAGWMVTIKETFIIVWGCLAAALLLAGLAGGSRFRAAWSGTAAHLRRHRMAGLAGALTGFLLIIAAYTNCFRDALGLHALGANVISMLFYGASTADAVELHRHPLGMYLTLLGRFEWLACILAIVAAWIGLRDRQPRAIVLLLFTALTLICYGSLSYKTPWLIVNALLPLALLAGDGAGRFLTQRFPHSPRASLDAAVCGLGLLLLPQAMQTSFARPADPALGLAYHHAGAEQMDLAREIREVLVRVPSYSYPRAIIALPYYWPLAWYLRHEKDVLFQSGATPDYPPEELAMVPVVVTLQSADRKFLEAFVHTDSLPPYSLPSHTSRPIVMIPPDYLVATLWIRSDLAQSGP